MSENAIPAAPDDDETVIVDGDNDPTVLVSREETVLVSRDDTVIIDRASSEPDDEDTISMSTDRQARVELVVDALLDPASDDTDTVIVPVNEPAADGLRPVDDDATVRVERSVSGTATVRISRVSSNAVRPAMTPRPGRRRGELRPAPVPSGFGGVPLVASGAGAVSSYRARTLTPPSPALAAPNPGTATGRVLPASTSVRAASRRTAIWALAASAASIVVIAGGMFWAVKDLVGF